MRWIVVEGEDGQHFFDTTYQGFKYARDREERQPNSIDYIAVGAFENEHDTVVYKGDELRVILDALDDVYGWVTSNVEMEAMDSDGYTWGLDG